MELNEIIAENLKRLRTERGLSLGRLAELSGVSKVMLSQVEKGESSPPSTPYGRLPPVYRCPIPSSSTFRLPSLFLCQKLKAH